MEFIKRFLAKDEKVEFYSVCSAKNYIGNILLTNLIYIIMWLAFDVFFIYILIKDPSVNQHWFMAVPIAGLNLLKVWTFVFACLKEIKEMGETGYVITDKAVYQYKCAKYNEIKKINHDDIFAVEKSEYLGDGFYIASKDDCIKVKNIKDLNEMFTRMTAKASGENQAK